MSNKVSAIITTCKRKPDIVLRAIKSVVEQTYKDIEIIVVDDSPSDYIFRSEVAEQIRGKYNWITIIKNEKQLGACAARNRGIAAAHGDYVAFLDDDDEWENRKIEIQVSAMESLSPNVAMVSCKFWAQNDESGERRIVPEIVYNGKIFDKLLEIGNFAGGMSMPLIKKDALITVGNFDEEMPAAQDYDVWLRIAKEFEIYFVDEPLVIYHMHSGEQITKNPRKKITGIERILKKHSAEIHNDSNAEYRFCCSLVKYYVLADDRKGALKYCLKAIGLKPLQISMNTRCLISILTKTNY